ncbi:endonuclease [Adlercreutzia caecimuris]|uniref:Endonuclease n=1 Tax=Adlercreutzia caecimuris TaxID=671266 RepID=A0A4S4G2W2_9ACTN|nr:endonuclease [Adlercreutzia caecimuris]THG37138.1 endonuclease [Adlercreutzia caecimuris]
MNRYGRIIEWVFNQGYHDGDEVVFFERSDFERAADALQCKLPKNLGDIVYSFRFRGDMPESITAHAPSGKEWMIRGEGKGRYSFRLVEAVRIRPNETMIVTKIPDATPEIIACSALGDEQALLALVRYNRLIDIFLGITAYSLQNHLRTTVKGVGQIEIDEIYVGVDRFGVQYIIPVQAKGHGDEIGISQPEQDLQACAEKWPQMQPRSIAVQFMDDGTIALFELAWQDESIRVARESHYRLVPSDEITQQDRNLYRLSSDWSEPQYEI